MQLLVGPPELRYIQNVAIMMFCEHPDKFFPIYLCSDDIISERKYRKSKC